MKSNKVFIYFATIFCSQLAASFYCNQKIVAILSYQPALSGRFFGSYLYLPFSWYVWYWKFYNEDTAWIFDKYGVLVSFVVLLVTGLILVLLFMQKTEKRLDSHGSAHFASKQEIIDFGQADKDNDYLKGSGVVLGYLDDGTYIRDDSKTHVLICAPTRSGKGVGHIVPSLLLWPHSVVVTDIKGENWALTAGFRKSQLKNKVLKFEPAEFGSCHYNPFDEIRIGTTHEMKDLQNIVKILVDPTGKGSEGQNAHWVNNAAALMTGVTLHLMYQMRKEQGRSANMGDVLDFLYDGRDIGTEVPEDARIREAREREKAEMNRTTEHIAVVKELDEEGREYEKKLNYNKVSEEKRLQLSNGYLYSVAMPEADETEPEFDSQGNVIHKENVATFGSNRTTNRLYSVENNNSEADSIYPGVKEKTPKTKKDDASLSGLQKKLDKYINSYSLDENGDWQAYSHAPADDPDMFTRLYPDKINRGGVHPHVRQYFQSMIDKPDKEFGSILSTLDTAMNLYRDPIIVENIADSDFKMKDLLNADSAVSLFLVFSPEDMDRVKPLMRVIIDMMWRLNTEKMEFEGGVSKGPKNRLLMLLDEFPALGKMEGIEQSEAFVAGYGIKCMIITQDINQINKLYTNDNYVISNCQVQVYHTPSDNKTPKYISEKLGKKTITVTSRSRSSSFLFMTSNYNDSETARDLMTPDEVARLNPEKCIIFCKGLSPILANKVRFYKDKLLADRTKIEAPEESDSLYPDVEKKRLERNRLRKLRKNKL